MPLKYWQRIHMRSLYLTNFRTISISPFISVDIQNLSMEILISFIVIELEFVKIKIELNLTKSKKTYRLGTIYSSFLIYLVHVFSRLFLSNTRSIK